MASGDLTASTPTLCTGAAELKTEIDTLNLATTTDKIMVIPVGNNNTQYLVFKVEREA